MIDSKIPPSTDAIVLGAGISAISSALVLQALGYDPLIVSNYVPLQESANPNLPLVPTDYAMASAYPHNLQIANLQGISAA